MTDEPHQRRSADRIYTPLRTTYRVMIGIIIGVNVVMGTYIAVSLYAIQQWRVEIAGLQSEIRGLRETDVEIKRAASIRLDVIEHTLFGDVLVKLDTKATAAPNRVETWQLNRDKELRNRLQRLEEWRLKMERR